MQLHSKFLVVVVLLAFLVNKAWAGLPRIPESMEDKVGQDVQDIFRNLEPGQSSGSSVPPSSSALDPHQDQHFFGGGGGGSDAPHFADVTQYDHGTVHGHPVEPINLDQPAVQPISDSQQFLPFPLDSRGRRLRGQVWNQLGHRFLEDHPFHSFSSNNLPFSQPLLDGQPVTHDHASGHQVLEGHTFFLDSSGSIVSGSRGVGRRVRTRPDSPGSSQDAAQRAAAGPSRFLIPDQRMALLGVERTIRVPEDKMVLPRQYAYAHDVRADALIVQWRALSPNVDGASMSLRADHLEPSTENRANFPDFGKHLWQNEIQSFKRILSPQDGSVYVLTFHHDATAASTSSRSPSRTRSMMIVWTLHDDWLLFARGFYHFSPQEWHALDSLGDRIQTYQRKGNHFEKVRRQ